MRLTNAIPAVLLGIILLVAFAAHKDTPVRRALVADDGERALDRTVAEVRFDAVPFDEAVSRIKEMSGTLLVVDWTALEADAIDRGKPVSIHRRNAPLSHVLESRPAAAPSRADRRWRPEGDD